MQRWAAAFVAVCLAAAACGGTADPTDPGAMVDTSPRGGLAAVERELWGEGALSWWNAMGEAAAEGSEHMVSFLDTELIWDDRLYEVMTQGEDEWKSVQIARYGGTYPWIDASLMLSADEILGQFTMPTAADPGRPTMLPCLDRMEIGLDGVSHWVRAMSFDHCRRYTPWRCPFDAGELVDEYLALWSGSPNTEPRSIYSVEAIISDTLVGESISGLEEIEVAARSGSWPSVQRMSVPALPLQDVRAIYTATPVPPWADVVELTFLIDADNGDDCPGHMGVAVAVNDDGLIIWEHRYHDIDSARRCFDTRTLEPGWWELMETPGTLVIERTGTISTEDLAIEVYNGAEELDGFIEWGFDRYRTAGLSVPQIDSVIFLHAHRYCRDVSGRATIMNGASITLCTTTADLCLDEACERWSLRSRRLWLHELAHAWLDEHVDEATRAEFLAFSGLPRWSDLDDPWNDRGVERAADTMTHSLIDEPVQLWPDTHGDCHDRNEGFRILTGADPIASCVDRS